MAVDLSQCGSESVIRKWKGRSYGLKCHVDAHKTRRAYFLSEKEASNVFPLH